MYALRTVEAERGQVGVGELPVLPYQRTVLRVPDLNVVPCGGDEGVGGGVVQCAEDRVVVRQHWVVQLLIVELHERAPDADKTFLRRRGHKPLKRLHMLVAKRLCVSMMWRRWRISI